MGDTSKPEAPRAQEHAPPPKQVADYARTCVQYVETALGVPLDYTVETLPLLDHYLREARPAHQGQPEAGRLVATVAGCYLGELLRSRHAMSWNLDGDDPVAWTVVSPSGAITVFPVAMALAALEGPSSNLEVLNLEPGLRRALLAKLQDLPAVDEEQFVAPSTRIEVVDMAVDLWTGRAQPPEHEHGPACGEGCSCRHGHDDEP